MKRKCDYCGKLWDTDFDFPDIPYYCGLKCEVEADRKNKH